MSTDLENETKEIFDKIDQLEDQLSNSTMKGYNKFSSKIFFYSVSGPLLVGILLIISLNYIGTSKVLLLSPLILITLGYLGIITSQIISIVEEWKDIRLFATNPIKVIFRNIKNESDFDIEIFNILRNNSIVSLTHIRDHIENERDHLERRIGVLVGAIEKVGLIPGLVTLYIAWSKIGEYDKFNVQTGAATGVFMLYILAIYCHLQFGRLDRYIKTFNAAIEHHKNKNLKQSTSLDSEKHCGADTASLGCGAK